MLQVFHLDELVLIVICFPYPVSYFDESTMVVLVALIIDGICLGNCDLQQAKIRKLLHWIDLIEVNFYMFFGKLNFDELVDLLRGFCTDVQKLPHS